MKKEDMLLKKFFALLLAMAMVFCLVACGGNGADLEDQSGNESTLPTAVQGVLTMATNSAFPPYEYIEGGEIVGIDVDIAAAIAEKLGLQLQIEDMEFDAKIDLWFAKNDGVKKK